MSFVAFDNGIFFYPVTPIDNRQINREQNCISRSCEKPSALPETINITALLTSSKHLLFFQTRTFYRTWSQQLLCYSTTLKVETVFSNSKLNQQLTKIEQYHIRCSFIANSKRNGLHVSYALVRRNYLPDSQMNETVAAVEELTGLWKAGVLKKLRVCDEL